MKTHPRFRSQVIAALRDYSNWVGKIGPDQANLRKLADKDLGHVIEWRICVRFLWLTGKSATVASALEAAEAAAILRRAQLAARKREAAARRAEKAAKEVG